MTLSLLNGTPLPPTGLPTVQSGSVSQAPMPPSGGADMLFVDALAMLNTDTEGMGFLAAPLAEEMPAKDTKHDSDQAMGQFMSTSQIIPPVTVLTPQNPSLQIEATTPRDNGVSAANTVTLDAVHLAAAGVAPPGTQAPTADATGITPAVSTDKNIAKDASTPSSSKNAAGARKSATPVYLYSGVAASIAGLPGIAKAAALTADISESNSLVARATDMARRPSHLLLQPADMRLDLEQKSAMPADIAARVSPLAHLQHAARSDAIIQFEPLKLVTASAAHSRQVLMDALGERIQIQAGRRIEHAVIRLDPPMMGSIEVIIRYEAGNLQVQLSATHKEVQRQLQNLGETLRQDLIHRQYNDVSVLVSNSIRDGEGRQRHRHAPPGSDEPGRALDEASDEPVAFSLLSDRT